MSEEQEAVEKVFAFSEQELLDESFNPEAFVSKHRKFFDLEVLKKDLEEFIEKCQTDIMSIMNNDYESFISLAFRLKGLKENIEKVEIPLYQNRHKYEELKNSLIEKEHIVDNLIAKYNEIKDRKQMLEMFLKIDQYLTLEEQLLVKIKSNALDIYTKSIYIERICRLDRIVKKMIYSTKGVYVFLDKCKERCTAVYTDIYTIITELYLDICLTKEPTNTLLNILRGYMYLNKQQEAIDLFATNYIIPLCDTYVNKSVLDKGVRNSCKGLQDIYSQLFTYIQENCMGLILASKEIYYIDSKNKTVYVYHFLLEAIWQTIEKAICDTIPDIFTCAIPTVYHDNYLASMQFIQQLSSLAITPEMMYQYPPTKHFFSQWDISVYSQIIASNIYTPLYSLLNKYKSIYSRITADIDSEQAQMILDNTLNSFKCLLPFKLQLSQYIWYYILYPLSPSVFIPNASTSFLSISLIIYNRYIDYLKDLFNNYQQSETASCTFAIYALYDLSLINKYILIAPFSDTYHLNLNTKPIFEQIIQQIQQLHDSFLHSLLEYISKNIYNKCTNSLSTMKTITSIYRMTNKPAPTEPSSYISRVFSPLDILSPLLQLFKDDFPYVLKECYSYVYEHILIAFKENADELLTTISRMEEMLSKHRKRTSPITPSSPAPASNQVLSPLSGEYNTDEQKMRLQLKLDIQAICEYKTVYNITELPAGC